MARRDWKKEIESKALDLEEKASQCMTDAKAAFEAKQAEARGYISAALEVRTLLDGPDDTED